MTLTDDNILPGAPTEQVGERERETYVAMRTLAALSGDAQTASHYLLDVEHLVFEPEELLVMRKGEHRQLYDRLSDELAPAIEEQLVREMRELAGRALQLEARLLSSIEKQVNDRQIADPARALTAVTKTKQTAVDKLLALTGRPTQITETRDASQIVKKLEALRVLVPLEASAEEVDG